MKYRMLLMMVSLSLIINVSGQTIHLTFTAVDNATYVPLDSIKVMNRTQGGDTVLYWPDTVLSIYNVGIHEITLGENAFQVFQNYPNPVAGQTTVSMYVPEKDKVSIKVTDIMGRVVVKSERLLDKGKHCFRFTPGNGDLCCFTACWQGQSSSIKILQAGSHSGGAASLEYSGSEDYSTQLKKLNDILDFSFSPGDELLYIGYADVLQSGMLDSPEESTTYAFQFATNIPCPGTPTVEFEGQVYNTIQILSQCWLKENLNVGTMISGWDEMTDNGVIEKYCYENEPDSCAKYGGLYQWDEMMQYSTQPGPRGICPPGWHLPTDEEWKVLEGAVDSQYGIGDPEWDLDWNYRGYDAGKNLKATSGWSQNGNGADLFGFSDLPGGYRFNDGSFDDVGCFAYCWTSAESDNFHAWRRLLYCLFQESGRYYSSKGLGFSVRCLRDN